MLSMIHIVDAGDTHWIGVQCFKVAVDVFIQTGLSGCSFWLMLHMTDVKVQACRFVALLM